ncbi:NADH-quinone oxidoreductase subunit K [Candidatus Cyrtobacter comes]|uniref:NADH-quinone oxidoreductase subunit K n=1 Tax=Candidatus Cyrtobacter comes TaxID=675776 RepID=A0ABU5L7M7_9RICK|nr:NADH-quinone oxidoreductase subunit NuoK [Candidatus Cyrtobacter comes]MDZ5761875.1 NADH-quinone oxidoreductase subunit K [Candidatus Cyrtobacter comes]
MNNFLQEISINSYFTVSIILFTVGLVGLLVNRENMIAILISVEIMVLSVNILFCAFSSYNNQIDGQIFSIFILACTAAEAAIGLAIAINCFRARSNIDVSSMSEMGD